MQRGRENDFKGVLCVFLKRGKNEPVDGTAAERNQPGSAAQHVPAIKNRAHDFKYHAADEKNRGLAFLTRRLAMKRQGLAF
jgi:hypothetical protein